MRSLVRRYDWTLLLRKRQWNDCQSQFGHMITEFFLPAIEEYDLEDMWFQQDGATSHTTRANMALLKETYPGHQNHAIWHH